MFLRSVLSLLVHQLSTGEFTCYVKLPSDKVRQYTTNKVNRLVNVALYAVISVLREAVCKSVPVDGVKKLGHNLVD